MVNNKSAVFIATTDEENSADLFIYIKEYVW